MPFSELELLELINCVLYLSFTGLELFYFLFSLKLMLEELMVPLV